MDERNRKWPKIAESSPTCKKRIGSAKNIRVGRVTGNTGIFLFGLILLSVLVSWSAFVPMLKVLDGRFCLANSCNNT